MSELNLSGMDVAILGAGAVSNALCNAFVRAEMVHSLCIWARDAAGAKALADSVPKTRSVFSAATDLKSALSQADLVLFAVADDALEAVAQRASEAKPDLKPGVVALHFSGYAEPSTLKALGALGYQRGGLHPLTSIARASDQDLRSASIFKEIPFAIGGVETARSAARAIAKALGGSVIELKNHESARALYHGAASMMAGGLIALFDAAERQFERAVEGESGEGRAALLSLLQSTLHNLAERPTAECLTGPIARGDQKTIAGHLAAFGQPDLSSAGETARLYRRVSLSMIDFVRRNGSIEPGILNSMAEALESRSPTN